MQFFVSHLNEEARRIRARQEESVQDHKGSGNGVTRRAAGNIAELRKKKTCYRHGGGGRGVVGAIIQV